MKTEQEIFYELETKEMDYEENFRLKEKKKNFVTLKSKSKKKEHQEISKKEMDVPKKMGRRFTIKPSRFSDKPRDLFPKITPDDEICIDFDEEYFWSDQDWIDDESVCEVYSPLHTFDRWTDNEFEMEMETEGQIYRPLNSYAYLMDYLISQTHFCSYIRPRYVYK